MDPKKVLQKCEQRLLKFERGGRSLSKPMPTLSRSRSLLSALARVIAWLSARVDLAPNIVGVGCRGEKFPTR